MKLSQRITVSLEQLRATVPDELQAKPSFDVDEEQLNAYARARGVTNPIEVSWLAAKVSGPVTACLNQRYYPESDTFARAFIIQIADDVNDARTLAQTLRHELKHAEQATLVGPVAFGSSYAGLLEDIIEEFAEADDETMEAAYANLNDWEAEANDALVAEWQDILPMLTERSTS